MWHTCSNYMNPTKFLCGKKITMCIASFSFSFAPTFKQIQNVKVKIVLAHNTIRGTQYSHNEHSYNQHVFIVQDFEGAGLRCSYLTCKLLPLPLGRDLHGSKSNDKCCNHTKYDI